MDLLPSVQSKKYVPSNVDSFMATAGTALGVILLVVPKYTMAYAPNGNLFLLKSGFGDPSTMLEGLNFRLRLLKRGTRLTIV